MKKIIFTLIIVFTLFSYSQKNNYSDLKLVKINAIGTFQFSKSYYFDYVLNSNNIKDSSYVKVNINNIPEGLLTQKFNNLLDVNKEIFSNKIFLFSKMLIEYNDKNYCIIKFKIVKNKIISKTQLFIAKKENNVWIECQENNSILEKIKLIFSLKEKAFSEFEIVENNPKYPEINKLKQLVKDTDGVLNIYKLAEVIEKNKFLLSKYLDN